MCCMDTMHISVEVTSTLNAMYMIKDNGILIFY